jgi:hypothetical protein
MNWDERFRQANAVTFGEQVELVRQTIYVDPHTINDPGFDVWVKENLDAILAWTDERWPTRNKK